MDWFIVVIVSIIIGILSYGLYIHFFSNNNGNSLFNGNNQSSLLNNPAADLLPGIISELFDRKVFDIEPIEKQRQIYEELKQSLIDSNNDSNNTAIVTQQQSQQPDDKESALPTNDDNDSNTTDNSTTAAAAETTVLSSLNGSIIKQLQGALLKRAIAAIERAHSINTELQRLQPIMQSGKFPSTDTELLNLGVKSTEAEINTIKFEANQLKSGWGDSIMQAAVELSIGLKQRQQQRKQAEIDKQKQLKQLENKKLFDQQQLEAKKRAEAKLAERTFQQLIESEERAAAKSNSSKKKH